MNTYAESDTLLGAALAPLDSTRSVGLVFVFSLFIAAAAQFAIHIGPIPITGQSFAVLLTGALLGSRLGAAAVIAYLIEGALGLPFFAGGGAGHHSFSWANWWISRRLPCGRVRHWSVC